MLTLVRGARRRLLYNELLSEGANATSAVLLAFILLLLGGTQILAWYWTLPIPLAALAIGLYRVRRRLPSPYGVAQIVDRRLGLADAISTAFFFERNGAARSASAEICAIQRDAAERVAAAVDYRQAVPYTIPRTAYVMAALVLVASSLFALRYALTRSLDLKPPLARILQQSLGFEARSEQARAAKRNPQPPQAESQDENSLPDTQEQRSGDQSNADAETPAESTADQTGVRSDSKNAEANSKKESEDGDKAEGSEGESGEDRAAGDNSADGEQSKNGKSDQKQDSGAKQDANNSGDNNSILNKMKDAMQNLLSRIKPQQNGSAGQQQQASGDQKQQGKGQQNGKQQPSKDGQQQAGNQQGDAQEGQAGDQAQNSQDPQSKGAGKSDAKQASKQPGSGIGSQDGDKNIKQAEQLAAMGKLSEIFGKRSATITGEATVEVRNTSQQLHTPYAQRGAQHSQGGAEISRDEVPVALQTYVEQYFEQVRKQPPPKK